MAKWSLSQTCDTLVRLQPTHPSASRNCTEDDRSRLEIGGQEAVALLCFCTNGLCERHSVVLFPTRFAQPTYTRGYLQTALVLPSQLHPAPVRRISYDGVALLLDAGSASLSIFASPTSPTVWVAVDYAEQQRTETPADEELLVANGHTVRRVCQWTSTTRFVIAYTSAAEAGMYAIDHRERTRLVQEWVKPITLSCSDANICALVRFAKIRACDAVVHARKLGVVHSPGGGMYYSGVWCNDQAEYAAPVLVTFSATRSAMLNSLQQLATRIDEDGVPYSIEIDGAYVGALDRGDAAMFAWGGALAAMAIPDDPRLHWLYAGVHKCCALLLRKMEASAVGVVPSQSDELEERFATGEANLSVNCLAILALETASAMATGEARAVEYAEAAQRLRVAVHAHFGVDDGRKYAYYDGCEDGRGWACLAVLAGLPDGVDALRFVLDVLWNRDGVRVSGNADDIWDRCTLYALRAAFGAGFVDEGARKLGEYAKFRLLDSVAAPYPVECNGSFAQLSAESALLLRVVTEGLLGIRPHAVKGVMRLKPVCPSAWGWYCVDDVTFVDVVLCFRVELVTKSVGDVTEYCDLSVSTGDNEETVRFKKGATVLLRLGEGQFELTS